MMWSAPVLLLLLLLHPGPLLNFSALQCVRRRKMGSCAVRAAFAALVALVCLGFTSAAEAPDATRAKAVSRLTAASGCGMDLSGILSGDKSVCCPARCGKCGGTGCQNFPGGASQCCTTNIQATDLLCAGTAVPAPCSFAKTLGGPTVTCATKTDCDLTASSFVTTMGNGTPVSHLKADCLSGKCVCVYNQFVYYPVRAATYSCIERRALCSSQQACVDNTQYQALSDGAARSAVSCKVGTNGAETCLCDDAAYTWWTPDPANTYVGTCIEKKRVCTDNTICRTYESEPASCAGTTCKCDDPLATWSPPPSPYQLIYNQVRFGNCRYPPSCDRNFTCTPAGQCTCANTTRVYTDISIGSITTPCCIDAKKVSADGAVACFATNTKKVSRIGNTCVCDDPNKRWLTAATGVPSWYYYYSQTVSFTALDQASRAYCMARHCMVTGPEQVEQAYNDGGVRDEAGQLLDAHGYIIVDGWNLAILMMLGVSPAFDVGDHLPIAYRVVGGELVPQRLKLATTMRGCGRGGALLLSWGILRGVPGLVENASSFVPLIFTALAKYARQHHEAGGLPAGAQQLTLPPTGRQCISKPRSRRALMKSGKGALVMAAAGYGSCASVAAAAASAPAGAAVAVAAAMAGGMGETGSGGGGYEQPSEAGSPDAAADYSGSDCDSESESESGADFNVADTTGMMDVDAEPDDNNDRWGAEAHSFGGLGQNSRGTKHKYTQQRTAMALHTGEGLHSAAPYSGYLPPATFNEGDPAERSAAARHVVAQVGADSGVQQMMLDLINDSASRFVALYTVAAGSPPPAGHVLPPSAAVWYTPEQRDAMVAHSGARFCTMRGRTAAARGELGCIYVDYVRLLRTYVQRGSGANGIFFEPFIDTYMTEDADGAAVPVSVYNVREIKDVKFHIDPKHHDNRTRPWLQVEIPAHPQGGRPRIEECVVVVLSAWFGGVTAQRPLNAQFPAEFLVTGGLTIRPAPARRALTSTEDEAAVHA
ncbi:hypothetical protein JKP88DRAFT_249023 [Tribonema minus]|uniref:Uncharacterized protein n=1 Tax=Tribonema minus TaxID=303371 RepID=A0A835YLW4_9STRA|nr:hypothetical protein JKP88DRAFT_249023 [Tribonema minus]